MDNSERAKRLAEIFGWKVSHCPSGCVHVETPFGNQDLYYLMEPDSGLLPWLLRELPRRKLYPAIGYDMENEEYGVLIYNGEKNYRGNNTDPLLALVDAAIAACGKGES